VPTRFQGPNRRFLDFLRCEVRYASLVQSFPDEAKKLHAKLEQEYKERWETYKRMAEGELSTVSPELPEGELGTVSPELPHHVRPLSMHLLTLAAPLSGQARCRAGKIRHNHR